MKYRVAVTDKQLNITSYNPVATRKGTSLITIALKGLEAHLEKNPSSDNQDTLKFAKAIQRESNNELEVFLNDVLSDLDISLHLIDLNNRTYEHKETGEQKTSLEVGKQSYYRAWQEQYDEEDGEKDFLKYLPDTDTVVEHGNELMLEDITTENDDWFIVEED